MTATLRQAILADAQKRVEAAAGPYYRKVINATGIVLHTALGRAALPARRSPDRRASLPGIAAPGGYGHRLRRGATRGSNGCSQQLTGAEAATRGQQQRRRHVDRAEYRGRGKEVIVSRGQLVEIGGSFRLPEVMAASGAKLVEVGTTNKTHARDYERAITPDTAAILRVHPSNYKIPASRPRCRWPNWCGSPTTADWW